jgi:hypothetical protein
MISHPSPAQYPLKINRARNGDAICSREVADKGLACGRCHNSGASRDGSHRWVRDQPAKAYRSLPAVGKATHGWLIFILVDQVLTLAYAYSWAVANSIMTECSAPQRQKSCTASLTAPISVSELPNCELFSMSRHKDFIRPHRPFQPCT